MNSEEKININFTHEHLCFVYAKEKRIRVLNYKEANVNHHTLIEEGWKHTATLDPCKFLEHLHNECDNVDLITEMYYLSSINLNKG